MPRVRKTREQIIESFKKQYSWFDQPCDMAEEEFIAEMLPLCGSATTKELGDIELEKARTRTSGIRKNKS